MLRFLQVGRVDKDKQIKFIFKKSSPLYFTCINRVSRTICQNGNR